MYKSIKKSKGSVMLIVLIFVVANMFAQEINVSGKIVDNDKNPLPGVTIVIKGTTHGTISDFDGNFTIAGVKTGKILEFSFIGFRTQEIPATEVINVTLQEDVMDIEEVQVVAYGTKKKATITGAISSVGTEELLRTPSANVVNTLAGALPGLATVQNSGQPGAEDPRIFIRGSGSLSDNASSPLILVDGVERSFSQIDPNEIENLTVLKDASATAVFGVRGANGVILVTTKRGTVGKTAISVSSSFGLQQPTRIIEMADSYTYATVYNQMLIDDGGEAAFSDDVVEAFKTNSNPIIYPNVNWEEYVLRDFATKTQHNINFSGGSNKMKYFVSLGYLFQDGVIKSFDQDYNNNFNFNRYNYRINLDVNLTKTTTYKIGIGGWVSKSNEPKPSTNSGLIWNELLEAKPFSSPGIINGKLVQTNGEMLVSPTYFGHPLSTLYGAGYVNQYKNTLNLDFEVTQSLSSLVNGLEFSAKGAYNLGSRYTKKHTKSIETYVPWEIGFIDELEPDDPNYDPTIVYSVSGQNTNFKHEKSDIGYNRDWYLESKLFWKRKIGDHDLSALALYNMTKRYYPSEPRYIPKSYVGYVGRVTYGYQSKYLLDLNVGYNGSENFAKGSTRYGLFPSFSAGWVISEESFMDNLEFISFLKLRGSYGIVGNDSGVSRFMYIDGVWDPSNGSYAFGVNPNEIDAATEGRLGNTDVTWETAAKQNYGIDLRLFGPKMSISADYFIEKRKDILIARQTTPQEVALLLPNINMGKVDNKGYEVNVTWRDGDISGFNYFVNANVSYAKNEIIEKDEILSDYEYMIETGGSTGRTLVYNFDRFYEETDFNPDGTLIADLPQPSGVVLPGDPKYKDLNNDMVIDSYDRSWSEFGRRPEYVFGLNAGFGYKGFEISTQWSGATNVSRFLQRNFRSPFGGDGSRGLTQYHADNSWTLELGQDALFPRITASRSPNSYADSDLYMWDASYIRLKNIQIGYTFMQGAFLDKLGIKKLHVYANGLNLLTFDDMKFFDPESGTSNVQTEDSMKYPIMKMYNVGVNINF